MSVGPTALVAVAVAALFGLWTREQAPAPPVLSQDPLLEEVRGLRLDLLSLPVPRGPIERAPAVRSCPPALPCICPSWHWYSFALGVLGGVLSLLAIRILLSCVRLLQLAEAVQAPAPRIAGQTLRLA